MQAKLLILICSRNPGRHLINCIESLYQHYRDTVDIAIIDSDSTQLATYDQIRELYPKVDIHLVKNRNYEFGAWKTGYRLYGDYQYYMCIQDAMTAKLAVDLKLVTDYTVMLFPKDAGFRTHRQIKPTARRLVAGTQYSKLLEQRINTPFRLAQYNSFVVTNANLAAILKNLPHLPVNKFGSCSYERILGLAFSYHRLKTIDLNPYFNKKWLGRK